MKPRHVIDMYVLDVLRHDEVEQLSSILNLLNDDGCIGWRSEWGRWFTEGEVWESLRRLTRARCVFVAAEEPGGLVRVEEGSAHFGLDDQGEIWFGLTEVGVRIWDQWELE